MLVAIMAMAFVFESETTSSPNPASLVAQLGSTAYAARVAAEVELTRLGRAALPALLAAKNSNDLEIRTRALALRSRIEATTLLQATPIALDFRKVPLTEALEAISRRGGSSIVIVPEERPLLAGRLLSLQSPRDLTFWGAIDALCAAGSLHAVSGEWSDRRELDGTLLLLDGPMISGGLISDDGPFRVELGSIHSQSEIQLGRIRPRPLGETASTNLPSDTPPLAQGTSRELFLELTLSAEPRLSITRNGPIKLIAAVDDRGRSLARSTGQVGFQVTSAYRGMSPSSRIRFRIDLDYPETPAGRIRNLSGMIPVMVAARRSDPVTVRLDGPKNKIVQGNEVVLSLHEFRPATTNRPATVELTLQSLSVSTSPLPSENGVPLGSRPDSLQQQLEILDSEDRVLPWFPASSSFDGDTARHILSIASRDGAGVPAILRFHSLLKVEAQVTFEFQDIPIP